MAYISSFGEVISAALSTSGYASASNDLHNNFAIYAGEIVNIYTVDSSENNPSGSEGFFTLYDVEITRPDGSTEVVQRCVALQPVFGGGINNYMEVVPTIPSQPMQGMGSGKKDKSQRRGHRVAVALLGGYKSAGIILGGIPHTNPVTKDNRPTKEEGVITRLEIQGLMVEVNNDGEFTLKFQGPKDDMGQPVNPSGTETTVNIDKDGILSLVTKEDEQMIVMDPSSGSITITNKNTVVTMDGSTVSIVGDSVETGSGSLEPHVCGDTWKSIMEELIDEISQIIVPTGVGPSGTPQNAAKFSTIKQKLKNALSTKHVVEK